MTDGPDWGSSQKSRHGCLTVWLVWMVIANSAVAVLYLFRAGSAATAINIDSSATLIILGIVSIFNVVCAVALLRWKKWGFWGFTTVSAVVFVLNIINGQPGLGAFGLVGVVVLWAALQSGRPKAWEQLE